MPGERIDTTLRLSLREGSVYYFVERSFTSPEPHYFIVINADPLSDEVLVLCVVTSQIDSVKMRRKACPETLVEILPECFDLLKKPSIVDCNDLKPIPLKEFNARFGRNEISAFGKDLPLNLRKALCRAIHQSKLVSGEVKALVTKC